VTVPLVSLPQDLSELAAEYAGGASADLFRDKVAHLRTRYRALRRIRGDGNCFYRAFYVSWMERLLGLTREQQEDVWRCLIPWTSSQLARHLPGNLGDDLKALGLQLEQSISALCLGGTGHGPFSSSTPLSSSTSLSSSDASLAYTGYDLAVDLAAVEARLNVAANDESAAGSIRLHASSDLCIADGSIAWLRLVTSAHMRGHREMFEPVCATEQRSFADFLATQVEAMGVEADEMHVQALTAALGLRVRIEVLDATPVNSSARCAVNRVVMCGPTAEPTAAVSGRSGGRSGSLEAKAAILRNELNLLGAAACVLYRPGHYDVLTPRNWDDPALLEGTDQGGSDSRK